MQEVEWETLSPLSQHVSFCTSVRSIFEQARTLSLFQEKAAKLPDVDICDDRHLLERAAIQDAAYCVHGFGAENHTTDHDVIYVARDHVSNSIRESHICHIAKLVDDWSANLRCSLQLLH